jgi:acetyltransferase-like isoleucine patch superfamily enzyme
MSALRLLADRRLALQLLSGMAYLHGVEVGRTPRVWGKPAIEASNLSIGDGLILHSRLRTTRIAGAGAIRIGNRVMINHGCTIVARDAITIGDDAGLAEEVFLMDSSGHGLAGGAIETKPIVIENGAWIGLRAIVLPGVTVGSRSIVGAGSIVTKDVPRETIVAGNPARHVRDLAYPPGVARAWHGY